MFPNKAKHFHTTPPFKILKVLYHKTCFNASFKIAKYCLKSLSERAEASCRTFYRPKAEQFFSTQPSPQDKKGLQV